MTLDNDLSTDVDTLPHLLLHAAAAGGELRHHHGAEDAAQVQSYRELHDEAARLLTGLRDRGLHPGDRVVLLIDAPQDFLAAFWACQLGGYVPCPLPSRHGDPGRRREQLDSIRGLLDGPVVITDDEIGAGLRTVPDLTAITVASLAGNEPATRMHVGEGEDLALLVPTSGSAEPRLVMLTHANLVAAMRAKRVRHRLSRSDTFLDGDALDHAAALLDGHLLPLSVGATQVHVASATILGDPLRWLWLVSRHRVTTTRIPAHLLGPLAAAATGLSPAEDIDLSCLRHVSCDGAPIVTSAATAFLARCAPLGLRERVLLPTFGMAETCGGSVFSPNFPDDDNGQEFAALGVPLTGLRIRTADAQDRALPSGSVGELQLAGPMVTPGYYRDPDATRAAFTADGWLRSGDLGRIDDGRLMLVGRSRDGIVANGVGQFRDEIAAGRRRPAPPVAPPVIIDGHQLRVADVVAVARDRERPRVEVGTGSVARMAASALLKDTMVAAGLPIYGVTSGFGDSNTRQIAGEKSAELQRNLLRFLSCGLGPVADPDVVRATLLVRANCLARGNSGVRPELVQLLIECLNRDILPTIPELGSVGASGDLVPLSYLAAMLTGTGTVQHRGVTKPAAAVLTDAGLVPIALVSKEGLALVNGTSFMSGFATLAVHDAVELAFAADLCTALASQVLLGTPEHFTAFLYEQKPHDGLIDSAATIRGLLDGQVSDRHDDEGAAWQATGYRQLAHPIQDRYSIRCAPQVTGVLRDTVTWAQRWLTVEINSSNDNPLFDVASQSVANGGNFYGGHVAHAMDGLKSAVASVGDLLDRQLALVVDEKFNNGLTPNLIAAVEPGDWEAGLHHGFKGMQIVASALTAEALKATMPASSFSRSTESHNQDKVSMGTIAARDARTVIRFVTDVAAIQLLATCQAADLRGVDCLSAPTRAAYDHIRTLSPPVDRDRPLATDIEAVAATIRSGVLRRIVDGAA
ncbi:aromatic amino acid lyase [Pseudonocardia sp. GCM10023141]|uniref:aromatic amino acid lyase n=1 Tax=Pseudonocardia sp. GCM10023141 TaxID=3252653 RepID=UPI003620BAD0